jgi:transposase
MQLTTRCLVHLLRELAKLREDLPAASVRAFIQPLITLLQDALQLSKDRRSLSQQAFAQARQGILGRFDDLLLNCHSNNAQCLRIWKRLFKHCDELFTFLNDPRVPADNNGCERDIRSLAAARNDGGVHRAEWSAAAFARIKSVIVTSLKNGVRFINYGLEVVRANLKGNPLPLPLAPTP